jgi:thiamine biosynthesis protein ThiS
LKIRLDLAGELDGELDASIAAGFSLPEGATLADLLSRLPFGTRVALTSVNGELVPPSARQVRVLDDGDEVMLLPSVKGG